MSRKLPDLSKAEWAVMQAVWRQGEVVAREVYEALRVKQGWALTTVRTMMQRLVEKGYLSQRKDGPVYVYISTLSRSKAVRRALGDMVERVLEGSTAPLVAYLVEEEAIPEADLKRLEEAIERKSKRKRK